MILKISFFVTSFLLTLLNPQLNAQNYIDNWPNWRGKNCDGVSINGTPPTEWSETKNVKWKIPIPGKGLGTPVVWENQIFITSAVKLSQEATQEAINKLNVSISEKDSLLEELKTREDFLQFIVYSINRKTGEIIWKKIVREQYPHSDILYVSSFASASCVTDGKYIFASFGSYGVYCFDIDGKLIWENDFGDMQDPLSLGEGTSPVIYKNNLIIVWDHPGESKIFVINKKTGAEIWQKKRNEDYTWATPLVVELANKAQVIVPGENKSIAYNIENGDVIWQLSGLGSSIIPCPVFDGERIFLMTGFQDPKIVQAINIKNATGVLDSSSSVIWSHNKNTPYVPSPLLIGEKLYYLKGNRAQISCVDAKTGKIYYDAIRPKGMSNVYASPVYANGNVYIIDRKGICSVIKEGPEFEILAQNKLDDNFDASPAIVGNEILLRGIKSLYCISE